ncbi:hypothetical protein [Nocardioides sp.]|uniref:hypothetical protein n=1 Tax=Nocardioides sp. TaxID=35761 RepID=UPI0025DA3C5F|nr:hypothetical protein [Nocardioides sp.]
MELTRTDDLSDEVDALARRYAGRVGLDGVLGALDRKLRRTVAPCLSRHRAWTWDAHDRRDREWWPQGVSPGPRPEVLGVTWYAKSGGSRLSVLDLAARRYRHVMFVRPTAEGYDPLRIHAGGLAWIGTRLHVAATRAGLWVADTDDIVRADGEFVLPVRHRLSATGTEDEPLRFSFVAAVPGRPDELVLGEYGNRRQTRRIAHVAATRAGLWVADTDDIIRTSEGLVLPVRHRLSATTTADEPLRFSFVAAVPGRPDELVLGEYGNRRQTRRIAHVAADGGPIDVGDGQVVRAQGIVHVDGMYALTASHGPWTPGSLWVGRPGELRERRWALPMGPEDLACSLDGHRLWTVTEHPRRRWIVSLPRP